jgi:hypothetical protein
VGLTLRAGLSHGAVLLGNGVDDAAMIAGLLARQDVPTRSRRPSTPMP